LKRWKCTVNLRISPSTNEIWEIRPWGEGKLMDVQGMENSDLIHKVCICPVYHGAGFSLGMAPSLRGEGEKGFGSSKKIESSIDGETTSCINTRNLVKFGMEEVVKNVRKGVALRHRTG
jgi:hypothetical protein